MGNASGVGREAPTFTITAADGSEIDSRQYRGDWFPVLVFVPTQDEATARTLAQLSAAADTIWGLRGQLLGICDAGRDECVAIAGQVPSLAFPLLLDDGSIARLYGALRKDGTVRPMTFIIDRAGKIVWTGEGDAALKAPTLLAAFREVVR